MNNRNHIPLRRSAASFAVLCELRGYAAGILSQRLKFTAAVVIMGFAVTAGGAEKRRERLRRLDAEDSID